MKDEEPNRNYAAQINTFVFRRTWAELINLTTDEDAGKLIKAICAHTRGESASEYLTNKDSPHLLPAAAVIINDIERNAKRFLSKRGVLPEEEPGERNINEQDD